VHDRSARREAVLQTLGGEQDEIDELLRYNKNDFQLDGAPQICFPLADELCVDAWSMYEAEVSRTRDLRSIYRWIPQMQFHVQPGLANLPEYQEAVKRGRFTYPLEPASGLRLESPGGCRIFLHFTPAGRVPVILAATRQDFVILVQAFIHKGEPNPIPESMGAVIVAGYNNFHRVHLLRQAFVDSGESLSGWNDRLQQIKQQKELYQDCFIILGPGAYSGVPAYRLGLDEEQWLSLSVGIRLEHECTHYFTRRVLRSMRNNLLDEVIADYCAVDKVCGAYRADWARHFLGIETPTGFRSGGRLENYRGNPSLSSLAFELLGRLVRKAVANLEVLNRAVVEWRRIDGYQAASILFLAGLTLEEMADSPSLQDLSYQFRSSMQSMVGQSMDA
jgi:hypothetical protein